MILKANFFIGLIVELIAITAGTIAAGMVFETAIANDANANKLGTSRSLPSLQTRARPPLQPATLHLGMLETQFFEYAQENNWAAIATVRRDEYAMHRLQPGGEGLYAMPDRQLIYVRGFVADIYFERDRLVGMRLFPDNRDRAITAKDILVLVRAWFPDDMVSVIYQVAPSDPRQTVIETLIGNIPSAFKQDLGKVALPFCRAIIFPAPISINTLSTCNINNM